MGPLEVAFSTTLSSCARTLLDPAPPLASTFRGGLACQHPWLHISARIGQRRAGMGLAIAHAFLLGALFGVVECLRCSIDSRGEDSKRSRRDIRGNRRRQSEGGLDGGPQSGPRPPGPSPAEIAQVGVGMPEDMSSPSAGGGGGRPYRAASWKNARLEICGAQSRAVFVPAPPPCSSSFLVAFGPSACPSALFGGPLVRSSRLARGPSASRRNVPNV